MTKLQVFIDFEAISAPFSNNLKIPNDLPYAYSIGIHKGKKFKTKTTIVNFNEISANDVFEFIRMDISEKIRILTGDKTFKTNKDTVVFVGWVPLLEKKILALAFKGIEVIDQTKGESVSLSKLTEKEFQTSYFEILRVIVHKHLDETFITRRGLHLDGALAALAGYKLYANAHNITKGKFNIEIDVKTLLKEINIYSKDDIVRMSFLHKNPSIFLKRKKDLLIVNEKKQKISRNINKINNLINTLQDFDKKETIEHVLEKSKKNLEELKKEKDNL